MAFQPCAMPLSKGAGTAFRIARRLRLGVMVLKLCGPSDPTLGSLFETRTGGRFLRPEKLRGESFLLRFFGARELFGLIGERRRTDAQWSAC
jgi:hypothetical protein